jgi:hypothetical protein
LGGTDSALTPRLIYSLITTEITRVDCGCGFAVALSNTGHLKLLEKLLSSHLYKTVFKILHFRKSVHVG